MSNDLSIPKGMKIKEPKREPDMLSKRGIPYWFGPEWVRSQNGFVTRIKPIKDPKTEEVDLHMLSKDGNLTYIQGSIQKEFQVGHQDRELDYILLGADEGELIATEWEYE